ncbi:hypothetical protein [Nostoc sp. 'Peltigera malacea cyanobiont' DB3992]|uniref:hypothetical protein n=1 Tax=Nostoc sp. 'Peltigera malacea cyanobiont' DB3992 TaxID=1206980 RepID=UPI0015D5108F|nr:hypothetical protein [Nostoc sp. 'Peltigera malacea cyanobiont' DB3992]
MISKDSSSFFNMTLLFLWFLAYQIGYPEYAIWAIVFWADIRMLGYAKPPLNLLALQA